MVTNYTRVANNHYRRDIEDKFGAPHTVVLDSFGDGSALIQIANKAGISLHSKHLPGNVMRRSMFDIADEFIEKRGYRPRSVPLLTYRYSVRVTGYATVTVEATDEASARELVQECIAEDITIDGDYTDIKLVYQED